MTRRSKSMYRSRTRSNKRSNTRTNKRANKRTVKNNKAKLHAAKFLSSWAGASAAYV